MQTVFVSTTRITTKNIENIVLNGREKEVRRTRNTVESGERRTPNTSNHTWKVITQLILKRDVRNSR